MPKFSIDKILNQRSTQIGHFGKSAVAEERDLFFNISGCRQSVVAGVEESETHD